MPRLIDSDVLLADIHNAMCADCEDECAACQWRDAIKLIEDAPTVSGWISVKDELPERGKVVIACGKRSATSGQFQGVSGRNNLWWWKNHTIKEVNYWMPLPEAQKPPKEDGAG